MAIDAIRSRNGWGLGVCAVLLCGVTLCGEDLIPPRKNVLGSQRSDISQLKPVTSSYDTDVAAKFQRDTVKRYQKQDQQLQQARKLFQQRKFEQAVNLVDSVHKLLLLESEYVNSVVVRQRLAEVEKILSKMRYAWGSERMKLAREAMADHRIPDAISFISEATSISTELKGEAEKLLEDCQTIKKQDKFEAATSLDQAKPPKFDKVSQQLVSHRDEQQKIRFALDEARVLFKNKRYSEALEKTEKIYLIDPLNMDAIYLAGEIYRRYYSYGYHRHQADYARLSTYTDWQWSEPVFSEAPKMQQTMVTEVKDRGVQEVKDHLDRIIFPVFKCDKADVSSVIKELINKNKKWDNSKPQTGVKIYFSGSQSDREALGKVTMQLSQVPLSHLIRYISLMSGLPYKIEKDGVHFGTAIGNLDTQTFKINSQLEEFISHTSENDSLLDGGNAGGNAQNKTGGDGKEEGLLSKKDGGGFEDEEITAIELNRVKPTNDMFVNYFKKRGIKFGPGAQLDYSPSTSTLRVTNTRQNLNILDSLIREISALDSPMVLIEVKSVEISDNDAQELGFHWSLENNLGNNMTDNGNAWILNSGKKDGWMLGQGLNATRRPSPNPNTENDLSMIPIRNSVNAANSGAGIPNALINNLNIFPMLFGTNHPFGSDIPLNISLTINALSQNSRTETLSAPKVLTESGFTARANMQREEYFPGDWDEIEVDVDSNDNDNWFTISPPTPDFGDDPQLLGIEFTVTPTILSDRNNTISLNMDIQMKSYVGRDSYEVPVTVTEEGKDKPDVYNFSVWQPIFSFRQVKTEVDVEDGETLIIGGSTINETTSRTDKLPFLGDLPLIGRFFQAQSEITTRRNMLIFVTARLIGSDGVPIRRNSGNSMLDFNR